MPPTTTITRQECERFLTDVFSAAGCPPPAARDWAALLTETSLLGIDSHGIRALASYLRFIDGGGLDPAAPVTVLAEHGACVRLDGGHGPGHIAALAATRHAVEKARAFGCGCCNVAHVNHVGATGVFARRAALEGCVAICFGLGRSLMAPDGGREPLVGANPLAIAAPLGDDRFFLTDFCLSTVAMGKVAQVLDAGGRIPEGWALDREGRPTTDPAAGMKGSLLPMGGHKGFGLALALEILTAGLSGGPFATGVRSWIQQTKEPMDASLTLIVLDIRMFRAVPDFTRHVESWLEEITSAVPVDPAKPVRYPGKGAGETMARRSREGIPLAPKTVAEWQAIAVKFKLNPPSFQEHPFPTDTIP